MRTVPVASTFKIQSINHVMGREKDSARSSDSVRELKHDSILETEKLKIDTNLTKFTWNASAREIAANVVRIITSSKRS